MANTKKKAKNKETVVITYFFLALFLAMIGYFIFFMFVKSESFINNPYNPLQNLFAQRVVRGNLESADGHVLATTSVAEDGTETRVYPEGRLFAHVVGYSENGKAGLEKNENFSLLRSHDFFLRRMYRELRNRKNEGDTLVTTLDYNLQKSAYEALGGYDGAVIVMEAKTGKILAMVSKPDFDPNTIEKEWDTIIESKDGVLVNRATQGKYTPGSVFKIFTTLAYYREHPETYGNYSYDCDGSITADNHTIHCAGHTSHGEISLMEAFAKSCNASYSDIAKNLDIEAFEKLNKSLLFNTSLPIKFDSAQSSFSLKPSDSDFMKMQTGIGQGKTYVSPLHMALITSAIANDGVLMRPYLVDHIKNKAGTVIETNSPSEYKRLLTEEEAKLMQTFMRSVIADGTGKGIGKQSWFVASGKTGTAQVSSSKDETNAWFCAYAHSEDLKDKQDLVVSIVVENSGSGSKYAVPMAKKILNDYYKK